MKSFILFLTAVITLPFASNANAAAIAIQTDAGQIRYYAEVLLAGNETNMDYKIDDFKYYLTYTMSIPVSASTETIVNEDGENVIFDYDVSCTIKMDDNIISLDLVFENFYSYAFFNKINLEESPRAQVTKKKSLFFVEYNVIYQNPYQRFFVNGLKSSAIIDYFKNEFNAPAKMEYSFMLKSSYRHTKTNCDEYQQVGDGYEYYFKVNPTDNYKVEIYDRFANTPIWYVTAVTATAIFMTVFYLYQKKKSVTKIGNNN